MVAALLGRPGGFEVTIRVYAVACKSGRVHDWGMETLEIYFTRARARSALLGIDARTQDPDGGYYPLLGCAPHKIITLRGEVSGG